QSTPLSLLVNNFKDVKTRGYDLSVELKKGKLITFGHSEWPTFGVGWPPEGTFCLPIITKVKTKIFLPGRSGHPDQIPYILVWQDLVENPPPWLTPFILAPEPCKALVARPVENSHKPKTPSAPPVPVLSDSQDPLTLEPPPYLPHPGPQPQAPPMALPGGHEEREAAAAPVAIENENSSGGPAGQTCGRAQRETVPQPPDSTVALPLREIGPPDDTGNPRLQYWPFSTSDLYNWKTQNAWFSDNPKDLTALLDSAMFTHQPTWDDCQQLLRILFMTEE
uniref:Gag protein n=1 Tax=Piliocolobus tephrosceles TaxID=591936 RepID=A0A8C9H2J4_9PRIM